MHKKGSVHDRQALYQVHNRLFFRLFQVSNRLDRQCLNELGLSSIHWAVLGALARSHVENGMVFSDLTEYLQVSRQNLDGVLKRLERDQLVQRRINLDDRRSKIVSLSAEGQQLWQDLQDNISIFYQQALSDLAFDDLISLVHLLNKVHSGLEQISIHSAKVEYPSVLNNCNQ